MSRGSHMVTGYVGLTPVWASPKKSCSITAVPQLCPLGQPLEERIQRVCCCGCSISQEKMVLQPLCKPGERWCCVRLCYGCCVSQERINVSAVPTAPQVSFQPLTSHLACSGFSKQSRKCEQWDNWCCEQDQQDTKDFFPFRMLYTICSYFSMVL